MVYKILLFSFLLVTTSFGLDLKSIKTFKANFIQEVTNQSSKTIFYEGVVFIKNDGFVLWRYKTPIVKNVFVLKSVVVIDEPELEQVIYSRLQKEINILQILSDSKKVEESLYLAKINERDYFITIDDGKIKSLSFKDELDNSIKIDFTNIEQNIQLEQEIFRFIPPEHYDIIKK